MLEYGMSKAEVLEQVYPDEVGFLLDMAEERKAAMFRELTLVMHSDPVKNLARLKAGAVHTTVSTPNPGDIDSEKGAMQLAAWSGNMNLARRIQLYKKASSLMKAAGNG